MSLSLLHQLSSQVVIDVDSMDPDVSKRLTTDDFKFQDMTSNQAIVYNEAIRPENRELVKQAIKYVQEKNLNHDPDAFKQDVVDVLPVLLAKQVLPYLTGNVHAQTSPSAAYDTEKTIFHAKKLVNIFEEHGIPKNRVCIKIPATPESMIACQYLQKIGIQTLATCLFSVPQALAASQAGCKYVAPYFNELRVHWDKKIWKEYANPGLEHPMSTVINDIVLAFQKIQSRTLVLPASIVTPEEVIALVSLKPDHITISGTILDQLSTLPPVETSTLSRPSLPLNDLKSLLDKSYLAEGGASLREAIKEDTEVDRKLTDALSIFDGCEKDLKKFLETVV